jgi:hypothetical protein
MQQATPTSTGSSQASPAVSPNEHNDEGISKASKITRKSHRKSRAGCKNCKTRRIKVGYQTMVLAEWYLFSASRGHISDLRKTLLFEAELNLCSRTHHVVQLLITMAV